MTEFAEHYQDNLTRIRGFAYALAALVALCVQILAPSSSLFPLLFILLVGIAISVLLRAIQERVGYTPAVHGMLLYDLLAVMAIFYFSGGLDGGLAALYALVVVEALLLLGRRWGIWYALLAFAAFLLQVLLDLAGFRAPLTSRPPYYLELFNQLLMMGVVLVVAIVVAAEGTSWAGRLRGEKERVEAERAHALNVSRQWALINRVALRIQESTTPEEVYSSVGDEIEKLGLHVSILEWAEPGVSMRQSYGSLAPAQVQQVRDSLTIHSDSLRIALADFPPLEQCVATRAPIFVADPLPQLGQIAPQLPSTTVQPFFKELGVERVIYAPMLTGDHVEGVLTVWGKDLSEADLPSLAALAQQTASALEKAKLLAERHKRATQLALVSLITAKAGSAVDVQDLLNQVVQLVGGSFGYHIVGILLLDPQRDEMYVAAAYGLLAERHGLPYQQNLESGILGLVARTGKTYLASDVRTDPHYVFPLVEEEDPVRSELSVPLKQDGRVIGLLDVQSTQLNAFDQSDVAAMEILAEQVAAALNKERALAEQQERNAQLGIVGEIAAQATSLAEPDAMLQRMVQLVQEHFGYYQVCVMLFDAARGELEMRAVAGPASSSFQPGARRLARGGLIALAARQGATVLSGDVKRDARYLPDPGDSAPNSELCIPLVSGDSVLGVLDVESVKLNAFAASDVAALETLANQIAVALEKARSLQAAQRQTEELDTLRRVSLDLIGERETGALLQSIVERASQLLRADGGSVYTFDAGRGELICEVSHNEPRDYTGVRLKVGEGLAGKVVQNGEAMFVSDYTQWSGRSPQFEGEPPRALLCVPLVWQARVLGTITLHRRLTTRGFDASDLRLANLFAAQAAMALENARLVGALQTQLSAQHTLTDLSQEFLQTADSQTILERAAQGAMAALRTDSAIVFLPNEENELTARARSGIAPSEVADWKLAAGADADTRRVMRSRQVSVWTDEDAGSLNGTQDYLRAAGFRAGVSAPMLVGGRAVGVFTLNTRAARTFSPIEQQTLSLLANQTAIALERASYFEQVQHSARELNLLFEAQAATTSTLDPKQVMARLLEQLSKALDLTSAYFVGIDGEEGRLAAAQEYFSDAATTREHASAERVRRMDDHPELRVMMHDAPDAINVSNPALAPPLREFLRSYDARSILRVPLRVAGQAIGNLSLWDSRAERRWSDEELRFTQTMASQAAAALANARLYEAARTRTRELEVLHQTSQRLSTSLSVTQICAIGVNSLRDVLGYAQVSIYFPKEDVLRLQVQRGYDNPPDEIDMNRGVMARAVRTRQIVFLPDIQTDPDFIAAMPGLRSEIAVPLLRGQVVLGVLNVETREPLELTPTDVRVLSTFGYQLATAISNAQLFEQTQQRLEELNVLHQASYAVNADLSPDAVLNRVADHFVATLGVDTCTIVTVDPQLSQVIILLDRDPVSGAQLTAGSRYNVEEYPYWNSMVANPRAFAYREDDAYLDEATRREFERYNWKSLLVLPLMVKGRLRGVVELGERKQARNFSADEIRLAESLANQAAIAIENARLYQDAQQRLQETQALYEFARQLGETLEIEELGRRALEAVAELTPFDIGEVSLIDEESDAIVPIALGGRGLGREVMDSRFRGMLHEEMAQRGSGIVGWVAEHGEIVRSGEVTRDPRYSPMSPHINSEICLPLLVGERIIGVLNLESEARQAFDAHSEQLLGAFARQLAIAIENARLYEQTKRDAEVKAALLRELSHRVKNNLAAVTSLLYMALDEGQEAREEILTETLGRVQSMALAHSLLARSNNATVQLVELGKQVLEDTVRNMAQRGQDIQVTVTGERVDVVARQTTTLALVLNELATNCLRHGFNGGDDNRLQLEVERDGRQVSLILADNGSGLPSDFQLYSGAGLGLNLVRTLVEKDLHGRFHLDRQGEWTQARVEFWLED